MNTDKMKEDLKNAIEVWAVDYYIRLGWPKIPQVYISDYGTRIEVQLPEIEGEEE